MKQSLPETLKLPERFVVVHLGAHGEKARLPDALITELLDWLQEKGVGGIFIGTKGEASAADVLIQSSCEGSGFMNLCGHLNVAQLVPLYEKAVAYIGRDSGPAHLASAADVPMFCYLPGGRPENSRTRWRPLGPNVTLLGPEGRARFWEKT